MKKRRFPSHESSGLGSVFLFLVGPDSIVIDPAERRIPLFVDF